MNKVYLIKLINGDELFSEIIEAEEDNINYYLKNPLIASEIVNPTNGSSNITLTKYFPFIVDEYIPIKKDNILTVSYLPSLLLQYYIKSLEYNQKIIEPFKIKQIKNITLQMDNILNDRSPLHGIDEDGEIINSDNIIEHNITHRYMSNTVH